MRFGDFLLFSVNNNVLLFPFKKIKLLVYKYLELRVAIESGTDQSEFSTTFESWLKKDTLMVGNRYQNIIPWYQN